MITRIIELSCDHPDCDIAYAPSALEQTSLRLTRVGSIMVGWTRRDGRDYCPDHSRDDRVEQVRKLAGLRLNDTQIGQRLGISRGYVQRIRASHGIGSGLGRVGRPTTGWR